MNMMTLEVDGHFDPCTQNVVSPTQHHRERPPLVGLGQLNLIPFRLPLFQLFSSKTLIETRSEIISATSYRFTSAVYLSLIMITL